MRRNLEPGVTPRCGRAGGAGVDLSPRQLGLWGRPSGETHSCVRTTTSSREKATATARPRSRFSRVVATKVTSQMS